MPRNKYKISYSKHFGLTPKRCGKYFLIQAGEALCTPDTVIEEHEQSYFEITYAYEGAGVSFVRDQGVKIEKGECFLSFPNETHKIVSDPEKPLRFICLAFFAKEKSHGNSLIKWLQKNCQSLQARVCRVNLLPYLTDILSEIRNEDAHSSRLIGFLIERILVECHRAIAKTDVPPISFHTSDKAILTHDIITHIDKNIFTMKTLSELENVFFYDVRYLSKCFLSQSGVTLREYFLSKKMQTALSLLQEGKSITETSEALGYSSVHAFSRAYTLHFGHNPSLDKVHE